MLDFKAVKAEEISFTDLVANLSPADLRNLTREMVDTMQDLIRDCVDKDVTFQLQDPDAHDDYAEHEDEAELAWNLGHLIVHVTASSEESAALAAELARGVGYHGRSRYETPWKSVTTIAQCRHRLEESWRMRLASLDMWPGEPHLDNTCKSYVGTVNATGRFVLGLGHDFSHLDQSCQIG